MKNEQSSKAVQTRQIVQRFLTKLNQEDPSLYYASTAEIARQVHQDIKSHINRLDVEEQALVRHLSIEDVAVMLGFRYK